MATIFVQGLNDKTFRAYSKSWRYFNAFIRLRQFFMPYEPTIIGVPLFLEYGLWRFRRTGVLGNTIKNDISGIQFYLQYYNVNVPLGKMESAQLTKLYRGCNRMRAKYEIDNKRYFRRALCDRILFPMLNLLDLSTRWGKTVRCLLLFAKATAFRSHNYVFTNTAEAMVRIRNIRFYPSIDNPKGFIVTLPRSKTRQIEAANRETRTIKCRCARGPCIVHELAEHLKGRMNDGAEALFLTDTGFPVTYNILSKVLKILCDGVGIDWHYYTSHALRIGEATDQNMRGVPLEVTMKFVCWRSRKSAMIYIRPDNEDFVKFPAV